MKKLTLALMTFFALASQAYAGGPISNFKIAKILAGGYTNSGIPTTRLQLESSHSNPDNCQHANVIVISEAGPINTKTIYFEQQYAAALTAIVNNNSLDAWLNGCTNDGKFALVDRLTIIK